MAVLNWRRWLGLAPRPEPDMEAFFDGLRTASTGAWTALDRYRDFRAVFLGASTPEQGKRVLWQIFEWARIWRPVAVRGDPYETYRRDGARDIGLKILMTMNAEPEERPTRAVSSAEQE